MDKSGCMWLKVVVCGYKWFYVVKSGFMCLISMVESPLLFVP